MTTQVLEGTLADIQHQLSASPVEPDMRLQVIVTSEQNTESIPAEPFHPTEFRNGVPLLPRRKASVPVTLELVQQLLDSEDEEILRACRTPRS